MEVVEDFESRPHKAVTFLVQRETEVQVWREQQMPKALPGSCGGKLPGSSTVEEGGEEEEEEEPRDTDAAMGEVSWKAACVAQSTRQDGRSFPVNLSCEFRQKDLRRVGN